MQLKMAALMIWVKCRNEFEENFRLVTLKITKKGCLFGHFPFFFIYVYIYIYFSSKKFLKINEKYLFQQESSFFSRDIQLFAILRLFLQIFLFKVKIQKWNN